MVKQKNNTAKKKLMKTRQRDKREEYQEPGGEANRTVQK